MGERREDESNAAGTSDELGIEGAAAATTPADTLERGTEKDPDEWVTGDEPPTGAQLSYLETLAREAGQTLPEGLTKAQASKLIDELQEQTGRGR